MDEITCQFWRVVCKTHEKAPLPEPEYSRL